jgi:hypothetical protein
VLLFKSEAKIKTSYFSFLNQTLYFHITSAKNSQTLQQYNERSYEVIYYSKPQKVNQLNVPNISRRGFSKATFGFWKNQYGSRYTMDAVNSCLYQGVQ